MTTMGARVFVDTHVCRRHEPLNASTSNRYSYIGDFVHACLDISIDREAAEEYSCPGVGQGSNPSL